MKKILLASVILMSTGCGVLGTSNQPVPKEQQLVLTAKSSVRDEPPPLNFYAELPLDVTPNVLREPLGVSPANPPVLVERQDMIPQTTVVDPTTGVVTVVPQYVPIEQLLTANTYEDDGWIETIASPEVAGIIGAALGGLGVGLPWIAGFEGVLALLSRRKRGHYANAAKAAVTLHPKDAVTSVVKALGAMHTNPKPEQPTQPDQQLNG
jgi:hypothetical protein